MHAVNCTPARAAPVRLGPGALLPTILFDEIDTIFGPKAKDNEEIRGFLNAWNRRSGVAYRCVGLGSVSANLLSSPLAFAAVAPAGSHYVPDTIASRSIMVRMPPPWPGEVVQPYRLRHHEPQGLTIGEALAEALTGVELADDPALPDGAVDDLPTRG